MERLSGQFLIRNFDTRFFEHPVVENVNDIALSKDGQYVAVASIRFGLARASSVLTNFTLPRSVSLLPKMRDFVRFRLDFSRAY